MPVTKFEWSNTDGMYVWEVQFPPVSESGAQCQLEIRAGVKDNPISQHFNITFGDVWFCTGQSNMQFRMIQLENATREIKEGKY